MIFNLILGESCNEYVDKVLNDAKQDKEIFQDPYVIPEKSVGVSRKILLVNYTGEASIYDGYIFGMSTLHRDGDVVVDKKKDTHLKVWLGAGELSMKCSGKVKLMGHGPSVTVEAVIKYVNMKMDLVPNENSNPKVVNFKIEDVKGTEVKVKGLGPLNFFMNRYIEIVGKMFHKLIQSAIEKRLKTLMAKKLKDYVIPEECINSVPKF